MCERMEIPGSELRGGIIVEANRDASKRLTEIVIVNLKRDKSEGHGMRVICRDDGFVVGGVALYEGVDIVGHAEMRG